MDRKNGFTNKTIPNAQCARHRQVVEALEVEKGQNFGQNGGKKYKIVNFKANFPIQTL